MRNIGNEHDAETILHWVRSFSTRYGKPLCADTGEAPEGWEFLGSGSFRSVWLSPSGIAYKVDHQDDGRQNSSEADNFSDAWSRKDQLPEGCRLPEFGSFRLGDEVVIAIERIKGETLYEYGDRGRGFYALMHDLKVLFHVRDMHDENVMVDENEMLVLVDFGL